MARNGEVDQWEEDGWKTINSIYEGPWEHYSLEVINDQLCMSGRVCESGVGGILCLKDGRWNKWADVRQSRFFHRMIPDGDAILTVGGCKSLERTGNDQESSERNKCWTTSGATFASDDWRNCKGDDANM